MKSKSKTREVMIRIRLTERERDQAKNTAKKLDVSMSELIRQFLKAKHMEVEGQYPMFKKVK